MTDDSSIDLHKETNRISGYKLFKLLFLFFYYFKLDEESPGTIGDSGIELPNYYLIKGPFHSKEDGIFFVPGFLYFDNGSILLCHVMIVQKDGELSMKSYYILSDCGILPFNKDIIIKHGYCFNDLKLSSFFSPLLEPANNQDSFIPQFIFEENTFIQRKPLKTDPLQFLPDESAHSYIPEGFDLSNLSILCQSKDRKSVV
jgi:hypothetical protein